MSSATPDHSAYDWVEVWQTLGCCISVVEELTAEEALRRVVTRPFTSMERPAVVRQWAEANDLPDYGTSVEATTLDGWAVTVEPIGYQATLTEPLAGLTPNTRAGVVYWSVNADMSFSWAIGGIIVRHFDPLLFENQNWAPGPLPEEDGLDFGLPHPRASAMALLERLTGVHLTREFLDDRDGWLAVGHHPHP
jgi:hypothetical protein